MDFDQLILKKRKIVMLKNVHVKKSLFFTKKKFLEKKFTEKKSFKKGVFLDMLKMTIFCVYMC